MTTEKARVLVIGGGAIGVGAAFCAKAQGLNDITLVEPNPLRSQYLTKETGLNVMP